MEVASQSRANDQSIPDRGSAGDAAVIGVVLGAFVCFLRQALTVCYPD